MTCHPLFAGFDAPRDPVLGPYRFEVLGPHAVEEDFAAVLESADRLTGYMGGTWPVGLTLAENRIDLNWHFREFAARRSFAWIIRDPGGGYVGCAYVFPEFMENAAKVSLWVRATADPEPREAALKDLMSVWLNGPDWPDVDYRVTTVSDRG